MNPIALLIILYQAIETQSTRCYVISTRKRNLQRNKAPHMGNTPDKIKAEERRQAQIFAEAIQSAIQKTSKNLGEVPMMNALAGGIVTVQAGMLMGVTDRRARKALKAAMDRALPDAMKIARTHGHCVLINLNETKQ